MSDDWGDTPALDPGNDFEARCWGLLRRRYKPEELVYIPATLGGDYGIEGYSLDGVAYQCYADRESVTLRHRTDKQKQKLYDDSCKLRKYEEKLDEVLDGTRINSYFLVVPEYHAAELVAYANKRAQAIREWNLSFIGPEFRVHVKTPHDYPAELQAALGDGAAHATLPKFDVKESHVAIFVDEKPELVSVLEEKLSVLTSSIGDTTSLRDNLLRAFLQKEQIMNSLLDWPGTWETVEERRQVYQEHVEMDNALNIAEPVVRLRELMREYQHNLVSTVTSIQSADAQRIAHGQTAEWLMRCPLRLRAPR